MLLVLACSQSSSNKKIEKFKSKKCCPSIAAILFLFSFVAQMFHCFYWFRLQRLSLQLHTRPTGSTHLGVNPTQIMAKRIHLQLMGVHRRIWWPGQCWSFSKGVIYLAPAIQTTTQPPTYSAPRGGPLIYAHCLTHSHTHTQTHTHL